MSILALGPGDEDKVRAASALFDGPARDEAASRFLNDPDHHLLVAYQGEEPAGFVSGVEITHPDKGTEMFLYELGVDERFRGRGIGRSLVTALATYRSAGAVREPDPVLLVWNFGEPGAEDDADPDRGGAP